MHATLKSLLALAVFNALAACSSAAPTNAAAAPVGTQTPAPLAFPGAEGFGALATGGRGCPVFHVTNLDDAGAGSFREAVSGPNRTVVFDVGGVIKLDSAISLPSNLTIAGQTAPGDGITIYNNACSISGQSNIIIRYVRFRAGMASSRGSKTLGINAGHNIILDHLTISWGRWDNTGMTARAARSRGAAAEGADEAETPKALMNVPADDRSHDITMQNCIVSEGLDPQRFGALFDEAMNITICRTLWADNNSRNPKAKGYIQVIDDVVYNWEVGGIVGGHSAAQWHEDEINNLFIAGPSSRDRSFLPMYTPTDNVYSQGNMVDLDRDGTLNPRPVVAEDFRGNKAGDTPTFVKEPYNHPRVPVTIVPVTEAYQLIVADAGDSLHRDAIDQRIIAQLTSLGKTGAIIHDEKDVGGIQPIAGGPAPVDSDHDGIPDAWETAHHLNPHDAKDANRIDPATGYTNLEVYLNSLVPASPPMTASGH
jgi:pectate lyase